jgi:hypothetical protein
MSSVCKMSKAARSKGDPVDRGWHGSHGTPKLNVCVIFLVFRVNISKGKAQILHPMIKLLYMQTRLANENENSLVQVRSSVPKQTRKCLDSLVMLVALNLYFIKTGAKDVPRSIN